MCSGYSHQDYDLFDLLSSLNPPAPQRLDSCSPKLVEGVGKGSEYSAND